MGDWGIFIILFVFAWVVQIILTFYQNRHYGKTVKEMSTSHAPGYLGVGVVKKRFGLGSVVILVSDLSGKVVNAKELTGVTVFSRFRPMQKWAGQTVKQLYNLEGKDHRTTAIKMAAERIIEQEKKRNDTEMEFA